MKTQTYSIKKIARGEYNVIDENGNSQFIYPTSKNEAQGFINGVKTDERFLNDKRMQRVAMDYINEIKLPVAQYGDLRQFMINSIYNMIPRDIREIQRRKEWYREHLYKVSERNRKSREQWRIDNQHLFENKEK